MLWGAAAPLDLPGLRKQGTAGPLYGELSRAGGQAEGATETFASVFNGLSAIGTWNLYIIDNFGFASGSIPGGWSLDVKPDVTPLPATTPTPKPKRCKKKKKGRGKAGAAARKKRCKKKPKKK
jgi:hypothetical protein